MPPGAATSARRQLPAAASAAGPAVYNSATVGEADQHMTPEQQRCEEPRKLSCILRSQAREVEGRGGLQGVKGERWAAAQQSAAGMLSGGKQKHDDHSHRQQQQHLSARCTRRSKAAAVTRPAVEHVSPRNISGPSSARKPSVPFQADNLLALPTKETASKNVLLEASSTEAVTAAVAAEPSLAPAVSRAVGDSLLTASQEASLAKEMKDACTKLECRDVVAIGNTICEKALEESKTERSLQQDEDAGANLGGLSGETVEATQSSPLCRTGVTQQQDEALEKIAKPTACDAKNRRPCHSKPLEKPAPAADQPSQSTTAALSHEQDVLEITKEAPPESLQTSGIDFTMVEGRKDEPGYDSFRSSNTAESEAACAPQNENRSLLPQRTQSKEETTLFSGRPDSLQQNESNFCRHLVLAKQPTDRQELSVREARLGEHEEQNSGAQVASTSSEQQGLHRSMQSILHSDQRTMHDPSLRPEKHPEWGREEHVLRESQWIPQRSAERKHQLLPSPLEESGKEQEHLTTTATELQSCSGSPHEKQEAQQACRSEDIRFFLRLGREGATAPRSVHVARAFLKDSWKAQRFFCKLFGVSVEEVIGLVDEQGFVSPFDGDELFIRNGGTYSLELAHNAGEELRGSVKPVVPSSLLSARLLNQYALQRERTERTAGAAQRGGRGTVTTMGLIDTADDKAAWQGILAEGRSADTWFPKSESAKILDETQPRRGERPPVRAMTSFLEQAVHDSSREDLSAGAGTDRVAGKDETQNSTRVQQQNGIFSSKLPAVTNRTHSFSSSEQGAWTEAGEACSVFAGTGCPAQRIESRAGSLLYEGNDIDMAGTKELLAWTASGGSRRVVGEVFDAGIIDPFSGSGMLQRCKRQLGHTQSVADHNSRDIRCGESRIHGEGVWQEGREGQQETLGLQDRDGVYRLEDIQEPAMERYSMLCQQREERWKAAKSPEASRRSSLGRGALGDAQSRMKTKSSLTEEASTSGRKEGFLLAQRFAAKQSKSENCRLMSTVQVLEDGPSCSTTVPLPSAEDLLSKKQQQMRRASNLRISAPLLVGRRQRLRRSLAPHEAEDPEEVATRQLVAEEHVRAVLARVSQKKALRSHLQHESIRNGAPDEDLGKSRPVKQLRREPPLRSVAPGSQLKASSSVNNPSGDPQRNTTVRTEPLLADTLVLKKAASEKIYVNQNPSQRGAACATAELAANAGNFLHRSSSSCVDNYPRQSFELQQHQRHGTQTRSYSEYATSTASETGAAIQVAAEECRNGTFGEEETSTSELQVPSTPVRRQYLLRSRHPNDQPPARLGKKLYSHLKDNTYTSEGRQQEVGGAAREDSDLEDERLLLHQTVRKAGRFQSSFSWRSGGTNSEEFEPVGARMPESEIRDDATLRRFREGIPVNQAFTGGTDGSFSERCGPTEKDRVLSGCCGGRSGASHETSSDADRLEQLPSESCMSRNALEWATKVGHSQQQKQQQILQLALEKRLFTSAELQRLLTVLETLKEPKEQQQPHSLLERLKVLLPPQTFYNLKLLLPSLLKTAGRLARAESKKEEDSFQEREQGDHWSATAPQADNDANTIATSGDESEKMSNKVREDLTI